MKDQLIAFETAKLAKEKGFSEEVNGYFKIGVMSKGLSEDNCTPTDINFRFNDRPMWARPTQSLLQRWLREIHKIYIVVVPYTSGYSTFKIYMITEIVNILFLHGRDVKNTMDKNKIFIAYEEALEEGLQEALKLII